MWFRRDPRITWLGAVRESLHRGPDAAGNVGPVRLRVSKLHGTGNDFLVTVASDGAAPGAAVARALCDRHRGVGADGLIALLPARDGADCAMELRNADGEIAEMSGNGIRCLAWVAHREGVANDGVLVVDTGGGRREVRVTVVDGEVRSATVDMGAVTFEPSEIPLDATSAFDLEAEFHGVTYRGDAAGIGNPHLVLLVDDVATARVTQHGPRLEVDERFPNRTNVEFSRCSTGIACGCASGSVAWARRSRAARASARRRPSHTGGGSSTSSWWSRSPVARTRVALGETVTLGGEVRHVFDVDIDVAELVRELGVSRGDGRGRRRLTATEVDFDVVQQRALLVATGARHRTLEESEASLAELGAPDRYRGRGAGRGRAPAARPARPGHLHRQGQGRGAPRARRRRSTPTW